jgi:WD40 repeat protein
MICSPDGTKLCVMGVAGYSHILDAKQKTHITDVKMNSPLRSHCFLDDHIYLTSGLDAEVYIWDLRHSGRCLRK